jgi:hypothetical protein
MKICQMKERKMFEFVDFLKRNKMNIPDRDVAPVFKLKYDHSVNIAEYSFLLSLLESQSLLDKEKSINNSPNFYNDKHKIFVDLSNES